MANKSILINLVEDRIAEEKQTILMYRNSTTHSKNTCNTQQSEHGRKLKAFKVLHAIMKQIPGEEIKLSSEELSWFEAWVEGSTKMSIDVHVGDSLMDLMFNKYRDVKNISDKIQKVCEKKGLKVNTATGIIEEA